MIDQERLKNVVRYDAETGEFIWLVRSCKRLAVGSVAGGSSHSCGYRRISVDKTLYFAHRLAWLYIYGAWPVGEIDHLNGDRSDNRIANLRDVPRRVNTQNVRRPFAGNSCGLLGVSAAGSGFKATISVGNVQRYLGTYSSPEAAHASYVAAKRELHEGCTL